MAEEVRAWLVREERFERLPVLRQVDAPAERVPHPELVCVEDELLVAHCEPALEPAGCVQDEVRAAEHGRLHRVRGLVRRLRVGDLRRGQRSAGAERDAETPCERGHDVEDERRLRRPERWSARLHRHRACERAENDRSARPHELAVRHPGQRLGQRLRARRRNRGGAHRPREDERRHHHRLVRLRVGARTAEHRGVPDERRVRVDEAEDDRVLLDEVGAEDDPRHVDRVLRPLRVRDGAHERLVGQRQMRRDHVVVALVDGQVDRLADRPARVVEPRRDVRELHEVAEVLDRPVAATAVEVANERRSVCRSEDRVRAAEHDAALRVPGELGELARRGRLHELSAHPAREADALAVDVRPGVAEEHERIGCVAEIDAHLREDRVGVLLEDREALLAENLERGERAREERHAFDHRRRRAAWRAARPPLRRPRVSVMRSSSLVAGSSAAPVRSFARGSRTVRDRRGYGSTSCGIAIAFTKCSWKRGSTAVSIFSTRRTSSSISVRAARFRSAIRAPVPAAFPAAVHLLRITIRHEPEDERVNRVDVVPNAPASGSVDGLDAVTLHEQRAAGVERGLGELDLPDVVLRDHELGLAGPEHVRECPSVRHYAGRASGQRAVDRPVRREHACQVELGDRLDDPGAAHARHVDVGESRLVRPGVAPDRANARLERLRVDANPLDRPRRRSLAAGDLRALERRAGRARRGQQALAVAEHDLGVRAHVHDEVHLVTEVRPFGQDDAGGSAPTWPAMQGRTYARAPRCTGMPRSRAAA